MLLSMSWMVPHKSTGVVFYLIREMVSKPDAHSHCACRPPDVGTASLQRALSRTGQVVIVKALLHCLDRKRQTRVKALRCAFWILWASLNGCLMCSVAIAGPLTAAARMPRLRKPRRMQARHLLPSSTGKHPETHCWPRPPTSMLVIFMRERTYRMTCYRR